MLRFKWYYFVLQVSKAVLKVFLMTVIFLSVTSVIFNWHNWTSISSITVKHKKREWEIEWQWLNNYAMLTHDENLFLLCVNKNWSWRFLVNPRGLFYTSDFTVRFYCPMQFGQIILLISFRTKISKIWIFLFLSNAMDQKIILDCEQNKQIFYWIIPVQIRTELQNRTSKSHV